MHLILFFFARLSMPLPAQPDVPPTTEPLGLNLRTVPDDQTIKDGKYGVSRWSYRPLRCCALWASLLKRGEAFTLLLFAAMPSLSLSLQKPFALCPNANLLTPFLYAFLITCACIVKWILTRVSTELNRSCLKVHASFLHVLHDLLLFPRSIRTSCSDDDH